MIGLADCNTFFASCERVFRPDLKGKPIVVLSNNDGCIVALTKEAKAVGLTRGIPYFKAEFLIKKNNVAVFSSNYSLYQDFSDRVMEMIGLLTDEKEVYSIDECFFYKDGIEDYDKFAANLSKYLFKGIGLPVSIAIARTKTLAKVANHIAKNGSGSFVLYPEKEEEILKKTPVGDVWGIGWRNTEKCHLMGVETAWDFASLSNDIILKKFTVTGYRTAQELRGIPSIGKEVPANLCLSSSISFSDPVTTYSELRKAVACHCTTVCEKMMKSNLYASSVALQIMTNRFHDDFTNAFDFRDLDFPTDYTPDLIKVCDEILKKIFVQGCKYKSARVMVWNLCHKRDLQMNLFDFDEKTQEIDKKDRIMYRTKPLDLRCASTGFLKKHDLAKSSMKSPLYTTRWDQLPLVGLSDSKS